MKSELLKSELLKSGLHLEPGATAIGLLLRGGLGRHRRIPRQLFHGKEHALLQRVQRSTSSQRPFKGKSPTSWLQPHSWLYLKPESHPDVEWRKHLCHPGTEAFSCYAPPPGKQRLVPLHNPRTPHYCRLPPEACFWVSSIPPSVFSCLHRSCKKGRREHVLVGWQGEVP